MRINPLRPLAAHVLCLLLGVSASVYLPRAEAADGLPLWTNRYSGPVNGDAFAYAITADPFGNVIVTGLSAGIASSTDYTTVEYSSAGLPLWTNRYNGPGNSEDGAYAIAADGSGNIFVTGNSTGLGSALDYATIAYAGSGMPLWTNRYTGPGTGDDRAYAVAAGSRGNIFVTGGFTCAASGYDYATIAYSTVGVPLWTNRYNGPGNGEDRAYAIAADSSGTLFVTGVSLGVSSGFDFATIAYSSAGLPLWTNRYNGPGNGEDRAYAIAVDSNGNIYVTGGSMGGASGPDYATIVYAIGGLPLWTNRYNGPGNNDDQPNSIAVDSRGNIFVTGSSIGGLTDYDYATIAYSRSGVPLWTNRYNGPGISTDTARAVAVDALGNVFVTGWSAGIGHLYDYATIAYSGAGVPIWTNRYYNESRNSTDTARAVAVDHAGNVLVAGYSLGSGSFFDFATVKYTTLLPSAPILTDLTRLSNGSFQFTFTNPSGFTFTALAATQVSPNATNWTVLGPVPEIAPGQFKFTDSSATSFSTRFYRVRSP